MEYEVVFETATKPIKLGDVSLLILEKYLNGQDFSMPIALTSLGSKETTNRKQRAARIPDKVSRINNPLYE
jgi:hypothetical protein